MTKKLIFTLLMSGVILSPIGAYAMDYEAGAPKTSTSTSRVAPSTQSDVEKVVPPFSIPGKKLSDGEHLHKIGDDWVNEAGTIRIPAPKRDSWSTKVLKDGNEEVLRALSHSGFLGTQRRSGLEGDITKQFPSNNVWEGAHYIFIMDKSGRVPTVTAFPYIDVPSVPSAAPAPTLQ